MWIGLSCIENDQPQQKVFLTIHNPKKSLIYSNSIMVYQYWSLFLLLCRTQTVGSGDRGINDIKLQEHKVQSHSLINYYINTAHIEFIASRWMLG